MEYLNSKEVAQLLGVNVSTIKRWTEEQKLQCERTAGGHRKFQLHHISRFLRENESHRNDANAFFLDDTMDASIGAEVVSGEFDKTIDYLLGRALACDHRKVSLLFNALLVQRYPMSYVFDALVTPVLHRVGMLWQSGMLSVTEEHMASQTIHDALIRMAAAVDKPMETRANVLLMNMTGEYHVIALKMIQILLERQGYSVLFSGQITPSDMLDYIIDMYRPGRIYISSTFIENFSDSQEEFDTICEIALAKGVPVFVGGAGFDRIEIHVPEIVTRLRDFSDVASK